MTSPLGSRGLGLLVILVVFLIGGLVIIPWLERGDRKKKQATARVIKDEAVTSPFVAARRVIEYEYTTESGQVFRGKSYDIDPPPNEPALSERTVIVIYDPDRPERSFYPPVRYVVLVKVGMAAILGTFLLFLGVMVFFMATK